MLCMSVFMFFKSLLTNFYPGHFWSTGRWIHNLQSYVFMFFMHLCLPFASRAAAVSRVTATAARQRWCSSMAPPAHWGLCRLHHPRHRMWVGFVVGGNCWVCFVGHCECGMMVGCDVWWMWWGKHLSNLCWCWLVLLFQNVQNCISLRDVQFCASWKGCYHFYRFLCRKCTSWRDVQFCTSLRYTAFVTKN